MEYGVNHSKTTAGIFSDLLPEDPPSNFQPQPNLGADLTIRCLTHPRRIAAALQFAMVPKKNIIATLRDKFLLGVPDFVNLRGNTALGMCNDCAYKFWVGINEPPIFIIQRVTGERKEVIIRTMPSIKKRSHIQVKLPPILGSGLTNNVGLLCSLCLIEKDITPYRVSMDIDRYE